MMADFFVVGHVAIDKIITPQEDRIQIGGPPTYVSLITKILGETVKTVTKVGGDIPADLLGQLWDLGVDLEGMVIDGSATTRFTIDYRGAGRHLSVSTVCDEIRPEDIVGDMEAVLVSPIVDEVSSSTASTIDASILALDPQGFVREIRSDGAVQPRRWFDESLMRRLTIYKSSEEELKLVTGETDLHKGLEKIRKFDAEVAMATRGDKGLLLLSENGLFMIPSHDIVKPLDPTGAGDVFMGGFIAEYLKGEDTLWCASIGASGASYVVETFGPSINASRGQIERHAELIYNRAVEL